jgi:ribosomal protein L22
VSPSDQERKPSAEETAAPEPSTEATAAPEGGPSTARPEPRAASTPAASAPVEAEPDDAGAEPVPEGAAPEVDATPEDDDATPEVDDAEVEVEDEAPEVARSHEAEPEGPEPELEPEPENRKARRRRGVRGPAATPPPAAAPRRSRARREPGAPRPVVRAQARYVRSSARKARLVCDHIRGKSVAEARAILAVTPRAVARDWSKLLESAVANAEHNHELLEEDLYVKAVHADEGPTIKRFRPRAMGRATRIRKRTAHLTILLTGKD